MNDLQKKRIQDELANIEKKREILIANLLDLEYQDRYEAAKKAEAERIEKMQAEVNAYYAQKALEAKKAAIEAERKAAAKRVKDLEKKMEQIAEEAQAQFDKENEEFLGLADDEKEIIDTPTVEEPVEEVEEKEGE